jgi:hypothetical protein
MDGYGNAVAKVSYTHDAMIDLIVANPMISQGEIANYFGYTEGWVSQVLQADAVRERMAARKVEVMGPLFEVAEKRFAALANRSMDILFEQLELKRNPEVALKALDITARSLGYGIKTPGMQLTQNFVVAMPQKSINGDSWVESYRPQPAIGRGHGGTRVNSITLDTVIDG